MKIVLPRLFMLITKYSLRLMIIQVLCMNFVLANSSGQTLDEVKVSITVNRARITSVFRELENKTDFVFAYTENIKSLDRTFSLSYREDTSLKKVLKDLSAQGSLQFKRINNTISVIYVDRPAPEESLVIDLVTVSGKVIDDTGSPVPGVNVVLKGTSTGTTTDVNGEYSIGIPDDMRNGTLVFSFIGYVTIEEVIGDRTRIEISLKPDVMSLNEVVVIGYQTIEKKDLTGAVSLVNTETANAVTANSVAETLQGLAPGVTVRNSGAPGQMARIEIRGAASFTNTDPLYVIDGMIADANTTVNNNDIETIQILKDASAAAIYGSRAANGVIIITTKHGKDGTPKVGFSAKYGFQSIPKRWDLMDNKQFAATQRTQYQNSGLTPPASVDNAFNPSINTDWQDEMLRTGSMEDYNVTLSGGSSSSTYLISGSYFKNEGVLIGHSFKRGSLRLNTTTTRGRVTFGENLVLTNSNLETPREGNPFYDMAIMLPIIPVKDPSYISATNPEGWGLGRVDAVTYAYNPVAVNNLSLGKSNYAKLVGNAYVDVKITDWLNYKFNIGAEVSYDLNQTVRELGIWQFNGAPKPSSIDEERARFLSTLFEHTLNFKKELGLHNINGVIGISKQQTQRQSTSAGRTDLQVYNGQYMTTIGSANGVATAGGGTPVDYRIFGYLGRVNYSFKDKYLLTLTGRVDQDSRFGENFRTGVFHSEALAWRISEEDFFSVDWIDNLKLHASYGELGIVPLGSWDYTAYINNAPRAILGNNQFPNVGITQAQLANPDLKWEERKVKNIGIDMGFLENRVTLSVEAYNSLSEDALLQLPVAGYLGNLGGNPFVNAGSVRNTGFEIAATYRNSNRELKWDISANATTIKNTVESVGNRGEGIDYIQVGNTRTKIGRSLGEWYLIRTDGIFQTQAEVDAYQSSDGTVIQPYSRPGDIRYIDKNDDGVINAEDRDYAGSPWPKLQTGMQFNASYKQFHLNLQFVGVFGYKIYNDVRHILDSYQNTNFRSDISPWSESNRGTSDPRLGRDTEQGIVENNRGDSQRWLENGSYFRLRNVELGYQLPGNILPKAGFKTARFFMSAQNLFTITKYKGLDPDVVGLGLYERGLDNGNWPASRVISFGVQCEF
jgi:TonB-dependent starch-binding outer membrane protein SusC